MADKQSADDARIKNGIEKFFFPILLSMIGLFLWAFYLKVDSIQTQMGIYQTDNAVMKTKIESLEKDIQELKHKLP